MDQQSSGQSNLSLCPEDVYSIEQRALRIYANAPISLLGIMSNLLNIIVFMDVEMRQQLVNHFLLALSISDLLLLMCNFCFLVLPVLVVETDSFFWNNLFPQIIRYSYPLALTVQTSGVYLTVLVSVHRFLGVCHPFKAKRWVTRAPVECAIIGSILFSFTTNIPTWLELGVIPCFSARFDRISQQIQLASFHDMNYIIAKKCIAYTLLMFIIPFGTLITVQALRYSSRMRSNTQFSYSTHKMSSNENISKQLHLLKKTRYSEVFKNISRMSYANILKPSSELFKPKFTNSPRDRSITMMLLAIVALFLLCNGLALLNSIVESIMLFISQSGISDEIIEEAANLPANETLLGIELEEEDWQLKINKWFECSVEISNVLIAFNSSTSTLVYFIFSSKYRLIFKSLFGLYKREKLNRVALTTAVAARRAMELSLIPEEVESRSRRRNTRMETTTTTALSPVLKSSGSSVIRREFSLDSTKKEKQQRLQKKSHHLLAQFRQQSTPVTKKHSLIRNSQSSVQIFAPAANSTNSNSNSSTGALQRRTMFRGLQKSSKEIFRSQSSLCRSLTNSESNLKLMDEQETMASPEGTPLRKENEESLFELKEL